MRPNTLLPTDRLTIIAWPDSENDRLGHDPRGAYVERYWLGVLGPTATWLLRRIADELEASPAGFVMNIPETAQTMGVGHTGGGSPFIRGLGRLVQFELAELSTPGVLAVRRTVPSLSRRHLMKLPASLQQRHDFWLKHQAS